jgi:predicted secreted protein
VYDDTAQAIDVAANARFTIALRANMTTPLEWRLEPEPDPSVIAQAGRQYTDAPPAGCTGCVGYGGTDAFSFIAKVPGDVTLHFAYREPKKAGPPAREVTVHVRVQNP